MTTLLKVLALICAIVVLFIDLDSTQLIKVILLIEVILLWAVVLIQDIELNKYE